MAYAKYTEEEFDPQLVVQHKKGELKLSPEGSFYVETVYDDPYDREFVSIGYSNKSWLNPVVGNDDKHKSIAGVVA